jgi:hypothetical protein
VFNHQNNRYEVIGVHIRKKSSNLQYGVLLKSLSLKSSIELLIKNHQHKPQYNLNEPKATLNTA